MTILEAIRTVIRTKGEPMTAAEIHADIAQAKLHEFHIDNPASIVRTQIRRHCEGLNLKASSKAKYFKALADGRFQVLQGS
jgi:restriction system protein